MSQEVLYAKYNYQRLPQFQLVTSLVSQRGRPCVIKRALTPSAEAHIARIQQNHRLFGEHALAGGFELPAIQQVAANAIVFDYVEGPSLDDLLAAAFRRRDRQGFWSLLDGFVQRLRQGFRTLAQPLPTGQAEIEQIFGRADFGFVAPAPDAFLPLAPIDLLFDNVLVNGARHIFVDNEWVFSGCLPLGYIIYRALFFYELKWRDFGINQFLAFPAAARRWGLDAAALTAYRQMEEHFQVYVHGAQRLNFNQRYLKKVTTIPHLQAVIAEQERQIDHIFNSYGYRLQRWIGRWLLPLGSRRRRWLAAGLGALQALCSGLLRSLKLS